MTRLSGHHIQLDPDALAVQTSTGVREALDRMVERIKRERFEAAEQEAEAYKQQLMLQAESILNDAREQAEAIMAHAASQQAEYEQQGQQLGYEAGLSEARAEMSALLGQTQAIFEAATLAEVQWLQQRQADLGLLLAALCKKLWAQAVHQQASVAYCGLISQAADALLDVAPLKVIVAAETLNALQAQGPDLTEAMSRLMAHVTLVSDASLEPDTVYISTNEGRFYDASLNARLEKLIADFAPAIRQALAADESVIEQAEAAEAAMAYKALDVKAN
ncbi:MAG: hypothetical protein VKJ06_06435 [Vampirovibrionales bacterium]|nr:hypothetical protein [Vampirovibrionales bacterium]